MSQLVERPADNGWIFKGSRFGWTKLNPARTLQRTPVRLVFRP